MKMFVVCIVVAMFVQWVWIWVTGKQLQEEVETLNKVIEIQKKQAKLLNLVYKDLLEREAQYD